MAFEYFFPIFLLLIGIVRQILSDAKISKLFFLFIILWIVSVAGFRYFVGPDWPGYYIGYYNTRDFTGDIFELSESLGFESGYVYLNWLVAKSNLDIWAFNFLFAGSSILLKSSTILKYSKFYFLGLLSYYLPYYFFEEIIQIRQGFACGIAIFSIRYIVDKKIWPFLLCITLAYQLHHTAIIFLPAYWIANLKLDYKYIILAVISSIILSPLGLSKAIRPIIEYIPFSGAKDGYNSYVDSVYGNDIGYSFADIVKICFFTLTIIYNKTCEAHAQQKEGYIQIRNLYATAIFLYFFFHGQGIFAARLTGYYTATFYILIPLILYYIRLYDRKNFIIVVLLITIYFILFYFRFLDLHRDKFDIYTNYIYNKTNRLGIIDLFSN